MILNSFSHTVTVFDIDYELRDTSNPTIDIENEIYTETEGNEKTAVIEWRYRVLFNNIVAIKFSFESRAVIKKVIDFDSDLPVISNFVKDSYNEAAISFGERGGIFPLGKSEQFNEIALQLLASFVASGLYI